MLNITKNIAASRNLDITEFWSVITFVFRTPGFVLFLLFNVKLGKKTKPYNNTKNIFVICVIFALSLIISPLFIYEFKYNDEKYQLNDVIFWDYDNQHFCSYDKFKNKYYAYSSENADNSIDYFRYYDKNGNAYIYCSEYDEEKDDYVYGFVNEKYYNDEEINLEYMIDEDCFCIDKSGYAHITKKKMNKYPYFYDSAFEEDKYVYYDENNFYYTPNDCSWDENGNLVFSDNSLLNNFDYNDIHQ